MRMKMVDAARMILFMLALCFPLASFAGPATDTDSDGVPDAIDNCSTIANAGTAGCDSDLDGYGNACDGDYDQNLTTNSNDFLNVFLVDFPTGTMSTNAAGNPNGTDNDCNGVVNGNDFLNVFLSLFPGTPGPSGLSCAGTAPCL